MDVSLNLQLRQAVDGDLEAYLQVIERYQKAVFAVLWVLTGDFQKGVELSQKAFVKVYHSLNMLGDFSRFGPWLIKTAIHLAKEEDLDPSPPSENTPLGKIYQWWQKFSETHQMILSLHYQTTLTYREIGHLMEVPLSTVRGVIYKGSRHISRQLGKK